MIRRAGRRLRDLAHHGYGRGGRRGEGLHDPALELYRAGLDLPRGSEEELAGASDVERVEDEEWRRVYEASARLPIDYHGEVFDPMIVPPEEPVIGSLSDDLADIYRDVVSGLGAYDAGDRARALLEWSFGPRSHWGAHATGAIRALHWWLSRNDSDSPPIVDGGGRADSSARGRSGP